MASAVTAADCGVGTDRALAVPGVSESAASPERRGGSDACQLPRCGPVGSHQPELVAVTSTLVGHVHDLLAVGRPGGLGLVSAGTGETHEVAAGRSDFVDVLDRDAGIDGIGAVEHDVRAIGREIWMIVSHRSGWMGEALAVCTVRIHGPQRSLESYEGDPVPCRPRRRQRKPAKNHMEMAPIGSDDGDRAVGSGPGESEGQLTAVGRPGRLVGVGPLAAEMREPPNVLPLAVGNVDLRGWGAEHVGHVPAIGGEHRMAGILGYPGQPTSPGAGRIDRPQPVVRVPLACTGVERLISDLPVLPRIGGLGRDRHGARPAGSERCRRDHEAAKAAKAEHAGSL